MDLPLNHNKPLVMHIDLNSCFATVCQQAFPHFRGKPLVVAAYTTPSGCVLSPSIEAKRCGIKTGMTVREARLLAPSVIVRTPDTAMVRDVHVKFRRIFGDYSPDVVPKSIDEAVLNFETMQAVCKRPLEDIAREIKKRMREEIGEWISCNVGIGTNRFLAKTAASLHKPDGLDTITHHNVRDVFSALKLIDLCGINTRFQARLNVNGIFTPLQFLDAPLEVLKKQVFQSVAGYYWYKRLRGYEVDGVEFSRKSIGQEYSIGKRTDDPRELSRILMKLCEKMGRRLRKHGYTARGIHVGLAYSDWSHWHHGHMTTQDMHATSELFRNAQLIMNKQPEKKLVSRLSVSCYELTKQDVTQLDLFGSYEKTQKERAVSDALDKINDTYGEFTISPATMWGMEDQVLDRIAFGAVKEVEEI